MTAIEVIYSSLVIAGKLIMPILFIGIIASIIRNFSVKSYVLAFGGKVATFIDNKLTFIGVIHHELSHTIVALITGTKIVKCRLFKTGRDGTLGQVDIQPRGPLLIKLFQQAACGIAPVICGSATLFAIYSYITNTYTEINKILLVVLIILAMQISYHMSMSKQDVKVASGGLIMIYIVVSMYAKYINIDYEVYYDYLGTILAVMSINLIIALIIRLIAYVKR